MPLESLVALFRKHRVNGSIHTTVGSDEAVMTDSNASPIHQIGIMIYERVMSDAAITSIIRNKGRQDRAVILKIGKQLI